MVTLNVAVVGHSSRQPQAEALAESLHAELFLDHLTLGSTWNHLRALNWGATRTGHLIVLEDDAQPVPDFLDRAQAFITRHPDRLTSFYLGTDTRNHQRHIPTWLTTADAEGRDWIEHPHLLHAVAYTIPCDRISALTYRSSRFAADEMLTKAWGAPVLHTIPSYVDHTDGDSIENRPRSPRKAWRLP